MAQTSERTAGFFEKAGLVVASSPELVSLLLLCGLGGAVAGWFFIGMGALFALIPVIGLALYWRTRRRAG